MSYKPWRGLDGDDESTLIKEWENTTLPRKDFVREFSKKTGRSFTAVEKKIERLISEKILHVKTSSKPLVDGSTIKQVRVDKNTLANSSVVELFLNRLETYLKEQLENHPLSFVIEDSVTSDDEEEAVLLLSDLQAGHLTKSFNGEVLTQRLQTLSSKVIKICNLHRKVYPIRNLTIFGLGDFVQNDLIGRFVSLDELEATVFEQIFDILIPGLISFIETLLENFETISFYGVSGNHGQIQALAGARGWDDVIYKFLQVYFRNHNKIRFIIADNFYQIVAINNYKFFLCHGDQILTSQNIPFYGITTKSMRWRGSIGDFDCIVLGHFHSASIMNWNDIKIMLNGTFVTDDVWCLKKLGLSGTCVQLFFWSR